MTQSKLYFVPSVDHKQLLTVDLADVTFVGKVDHLMYSVVEVVEADKTVSLGP